MDQKRIKEAEQGAIELLPKMREALAKKADSRMQITWRYSKNVQDPVEHAKPALKKVYGKALSYQLITHGQPDHFGDLAKTNSVAVHAEYELASVIKHVEAKQ